MVRLIDVTKVYENGTEALKGVSFRIDDGEFVFLVGPSGSGKSTVTRLLTAEIPPTSGRVIVNGHNLNTIRPSKVPYLRRTLGVVFQDFRLIQKKTAWENLAFAMRAVGASPRAIRKRIPYVLELVGLEGKAKEFPTQMSGGEQQRLAIARALVNNPQMIIADEPTGNLDPGRSVEIMDLLERINELGTTMLVVTHEKGLVDRLGKRVIAIQDGIILHDEMGGYYDYEQIGQERDDDEGSGEGPQGLGADRGFDAGESGGDGGEAVGAGDGGDDDGFDQRLSAHLSDRLEPDGEPAGDHGEAAPAGPGADEGGQSQPAQEP